jgi:hypothetical protein
LAEECRLSFQTFSWRPHLCPKGGWWQQEPL